MTTCINSLTTQCKIFIIFIKCLLKGLHALLHLHHSQICFPNSKKFIHYFANENSLRTNTALYVKTHYIHTLN